MTYIMHGETRPELDIDLQSYNVLHELRVSAELELPLATQLLYFWITT